MADLDDYLVHPPAYDSDDDAAPRPGFSLLEKYAYFDNRQNATTAVCDLDKGSIQVTFCVAHPPRASYFCVHATHFRPAKFGAPPQILATEGPLALIRVIIGRRKPAEGEYLVYHAGGNPSEGGRRPPSLKRLPNPAPYFFNESSVAIVRHCPRRASAQCRLALLPRRRDIKEEEDHDCGDCNYVIAALGYLGFFSKARYELCRYHSESETWTTPEPMVVDREHGPYPSGSECKTITIGGEEGTVAWADIGKYPRGIIFCDVLTITDSSPRPPVVRCLDLPPPIKSFKDSAGYVRDIDLVDGSIVYIELQIQDGEYAWQANTWRIKINHSLALSSSQWQREHTFGSSEISKSLHNKLHVSDADTAFYVGLPILSLQDDGIVYILTTNSLPDWYTKSWVLAIDMKKKKVQEVQEFDTKRGFYLFRAYFTPSWISKYIQVNPGTREQKAKRQKTCQELLGISMETHSEDDMELDDEDDDTTSLPEPEVIPALTPEQLELDFAGQPWLLGSEDEQEEPCKPYQIPQSQGSV